MLVDKFSKFPSNLNGLRDALVGKGTELICIQNSDPFYCHLHKEQEERGEAERR